jgi:hypothetical protein
MSIHRNIMVFFSNFYVRLKLFKNLVILKRILHIALKLRLLVKISLIIMSEGFVCFCTVGRYKRNLKLMV